MRLVTCGAACGAAWCQQAFLELFKGLQKPSKCSARPLLALFSLVLSFSPFEVLCRSSLLPCRSRFPFPGLTGFQLCLVLDVKWVFKVSKRPVDTSLAQQWRSMVSTGLFWSFQRPSKSLQIGLQTLSKCSQCFARRSRAPASEASTVQTKCLKIDPSLSLLLSIAFLCLTTLQT